MTRILRSIEKISKEIGYDIGCSYDVVQADLLNGFCDGLSNSIPILSERNMQICYIAKALGKNTINVLSEIVEFGKLRESPNDKQ